MINRIRHSLAHIMATAVKNLYKEIKFGIGPVIENGFYYDFEINADSRKLESRSTQITLEDLPKIEEEMRKLIRQNIRFEKREITLKEAEELFKGQPYKLELIKELPKDKITIYESSDFIDLCAGPHIKSTKEINPDAFKLMKIAGAYWQGDEKNPMLTRIYGVAFNTKKELEEYLALQTELEKRDHRRLGAQLDLFSFHDIAPGAPFWHPKGMAIVKELENFIHDLQQKHGYLETRTPILAKEELYKTSGHLEHYAENLFPIEIDKERFDLKPMNCPESAYIYAARTRSYKDLPLRLYEFGNLHRRERSGTLTGLFRVYGFVQDDAHIYCAPEQIQKEIKGVLSLIKTVHKTFGLKTIFALATKPDNAMGDPRLWQKAEHALKYALKENKLAYELRPKDGAFYGPKIDVDVEDSLKRKWTVATIQIDFQMPERFDLSYIDEKGKKQRPVIIHRSSIGSFERFIGILLEHFGGALPLWLSPVQIQIIPVAGRHEKYAQKTEKILSENIANIRVRINNQNETVGKKIREAEIQKIPYILVVGDKEEKSNSASIRERKKGDLGISKLDKFIKKIIMEIEKKK